MAIIQAMRALEAVIAAGVDRPVTVDPRNLVCPGVLIEPPRLDTTDATMCGQVRGTLNVFCVGVPGAWAEFGPLAALADAVIEALDDSDACSWTTAEFVPFQIPNESMAAEPAMAYQISVEVFV